jgi:hypothetical protein
VPVNPSDLRANRPASLVAVAVIELLEAAGVLVYAVLSVVGASGAYPLTTFGVAGTFVLAAALLVLVGIGTLRGRPWSRTSGMVWQVVQAIIGLSALTGEGGQPVIAILLVVPAVLALALLLSRPVREATARSAGPS